MQTNSRIQIRTPDNKLALILDAPAVEGYVIGRADDATRYIPDIDLLPYGAREFGVSRKHAVLVRYRGGVHIVDLNSVNGTYINGERLAPEIPYALNDGDKIMLGNLELIITKAEAPASL